MTMEDDGNAHFFRRVNGIPHLVAGISAALGSEYVKDVRAAAMAALATARREIEELQVSVEEEAAQRAYYEDCVRHGGQVEYLWAELDERERQGWRDRARGALWTP